MSQYVRDRRQKGNTATKYGFAFGGEINFYPKQVSKRLTRNNEPVSVNQGKRRNDDVLTMTDAAHAITEMVGESILPMPRGVDMIAHKSPLNPEIRILCRDEDNVTRRGVPELNPTRIVQLGGEQRRTMLYNEGGEEPTKRRKHATNEELTRSSVLDIAATQLLGSRVRPMSAQEARVVLADSEHRQRGHDVATGAIDIPQIGVDSERAQEARGVLPDSQYRQRGHDVATVALEIPQIGVDSKRAQATPVLSNHHIQRQGGQTAELSFESAVNLSASSDHARVTPFAKVATFAAPRGFDNAASLGAGNTATPPPPRRTTATMAQESGHMVPSQPDQRRSGGLISGKKSLALPPQPPQHAARAPSVNIPQDRPRIAYRPILYPNNNTAIAEPSRNAVAGFTVAGRTDSLPATQLVKQVAPVVLWGVPETTTFFAQPMVADKTRQGALNTPGKIPVPRNGVAADRTTEAVNSINRSEKTPTVTQRALPRPGAAADIANQFAQPARVDATTTGERSKWAPFVSASADVMVPMPADTINHSTNNFALANIKDRVMAIVSGPDVSGTLFAKRHPEAVQGRTPARKQRGYTAIADMDRGVGSVPVRDASGIAEGVGQANTRVFNRQTRDAIEIDVQDMNGGGQKGHTLRTRPDLLQLLNHNIQKDEDAQSVVSITDRRQAMQV